jgi:1-acyl-sn-glycerol-3-phosphate acyltransferase
MLRSLIFAIAFYGVTALYLLLGSWLLLAPRRWAMVGLALHARTSCWLLKRIVGTSMEVRGRQHLPHPPYLIVSKHQSTWDTFALIPLLSDPAIVLKDELKWIPFYGWFCVKFQHILVRRDKASAALKALIETAKDRAEDGREIVIFPEGTRQIPGADPDYKPGYVALYEALNVPCVPVALNSGLYWPRRQLIRHPGVIVVEFLEPMAPGLPRKEFRKLLESRLEAACTALIAEATAKNPDLPIPEQAKTRLASSPGLTGQN